MVNTTIFGYGGNGVGSSVSASESARAAAAAGNAQREVTYLEDRLERLSLVCMAMWSLIQDKTNLSEEDLMERVKMIDLMDGVEDGKASKGVQKCHACNRTMSPKHQKCLYCGAEKLAQSAFDRI